MAAGSGYWVEGEDRGDDRSWRVVATRLKVKIEKMIGVVGMLLLREDGGDLGDLEEAVVTLNWHRIDSSAATSIMVGDVVVGRW